MTDSKVKQLQHHTRCGENGEYCQIQKIKCGSDIEKCPVYRTFYIIGKKWTLEILQEFSINNGARRFNKIQNSLYWITPKVISKRLKEMEKEGLIHRKVFSDSIPVKVEYSLTEKGKELDMVIQEARKWGKRWEIAD